MNFKLTKLKIIVSLIVGLITFFYCSGGIKCDSSNGCTEAIWIWPLYPSIFLVITILFLWGLVQKKKEK